MILNDVVDLEDDRRDRPTRPLAANRISPAIAGHVGTALLMISPLIILAVTVLHTTEPLWQGAAFACAVLLSLCVRAYDSSLKQTLIAPILMGGCRALNILMVGCTMFSLQVAVQPVPTESPASETQRDQAYHQPGLTLVQFVQNRSQPVVESGLQSLPSPQAPTGLEPSNLQLPDAQPGQQTQSPAARLLTEQMRPPAESAATPATELATPVGPARPFPMPLLYLALGIGVYIAGVTIYALKEEHDEGSSGNLTFGLILQVVGLIVIGCLPRFAEGSPRWLLDPSRGYPLLIALIGLTVMNRAVQGIFHPVSRKVQLAVKHALLTLILLDAVVVLMWAGPWYGAIVVLLLFPALSSAMRIRTT